MSYQLHFTTRYAYPSLKTGITVPVVLTVGTQTVQVSAKVDTGSELCVFSREVGEDLGLTIESGERREMSGIVGRKLVVYGHPVLLETLDLVLDTFVYFCAEENIPRNLLGRLGWLQLLRIALIEYDQELYLSLYNE